MPIRGWVYIAIAAVMAVIAIVFFIAAAIRKSDRFYPALFGAVMTVLAVLVGTSAPKAYDEARAQRTALANVTADHPDFKIQTLDSGAMTITYIRPATGNDPLYCSANLLKLNGRYLVATVGAQCAPYNN